MAECVLNLNKDSFVQKFLNPISKLADNISLLIKEESIQAVCASADGSIILLANYNLESDNKDLKLNLPDIKKFVRLLDCVEESTISLKIKDNCIKYTTPSFKFNYFLLEDAYMQKCPVNPEKINKLEYDSSFTLTNNKFNEIIKGSTIATDTNKIYFYTKDDQVYAELNDFERQNITCMTYSIASSYNGEPIKNTLPFNLDNFRLISGLKTDSIKVSINNTLKVILFEVSNDITTIKFIISALVK